MEPTRNVARRLAKQGLIVITQKGVPVKDVDNFKGPIRLKLPTAKFSDGANDTKSAQHSDVVPEKGSLKKEEL